VNKLWLVSKEAAEFTGLKRYFTGDPCKHGHVAERNVSTRICCECARIRAAEKIETIKSLTDDEDRGRKERYNKYKRDFKKENPLTVRARDINMRASAFGIEGRVTARDIAGIVNSQNGICTYCWKQVGDKYHFDHKTPYDRGGKNYPSNIHIVCPSCNSRKGTMTHEEFLERRT
jgi:5-methylcytosine-specific restriction endonuclease McrA